MASHEYHIRNTASPAPPFHGAPPMPAGVNIPAHLWNAGTWVLNPNFDPLAARRTFSSNDANAWMPNPNFDPTAPPWMPSHAWHDIYQQQHYNPSRRQPRQPSAEYLASKLSDNPLGLTNMIPAEALERQEREKKEKEQMEAEASTPWLWNPRTLDADESDDEDSLTQDQAPPRNATNQIYAAPTQNQMPERPQSAQAPESFTSKAMLQPTFSVNIVRTPEHYTIPIPSRTIRGATAPTQIYAPPSGSSTRGSSAEAITTRISHMSVNDTSWHTSEPSIITPAAKSKRKVSFVLPDDTLDTSQMNGPSSLPPSWSSSLSKLSRMRKRRKGFWNRRGDHVTPEGYIVYAPGPLAYPKDLNDYPDGKDGGYQNEHGIKTTWAPRPELSPMGGYESIIEWMPVFDDNAGDSPATFAPRNNRALNILSAVLASKSKYKKLLKTSGEEAGILLSLLHKLLDTREIPEDFRGPTISAMMRLCKTSGTYPRRLALHGVEFKATPLASGSFGDIFRGRLGSYSVSLKVNRVYQRSQHDIKHFISSYAKEAVVWSQLKHPNILPFYGIFHLDESYGLGRIALVSPWMDNGNISVYLATNPNAARLSLVLDILEGLSYLHRLSLVHGDLKGANILITPEGSACLADFGLSSVDHPDILRWTSVSTVTPTGGTIRWQAPELMTSDEGSFRPTLKSDIYSTASVVYEVLVGKLPYHEYNNNATVIRQVLLEIRPTKPSQALAATLELTEDIWEIMGQCWATSPNARPTVEEVIAQFSQIQPSPLTYQRMTTRERQRLEQGGRESFNVGLSTPCSQDFRQQLGGYESELSDAEVDILDRLADQ